MSISPGLSKVLNRLAELAHTNTNKDVFESDIVSQSGLPEFEVQNYLNELESRGLGKEVRPRPSGADFRLWRVTGDGLKTLQDQDLK